MKSDDKRLRDGKNKEEGESAITRSLPHDKKLMQIYVNQNTLHCNVDSHEKDVVPKNDKSGLTDRSAKNNEFYELELLGIQPKHSSDTFMGDFNDLLSNEDKRSWVDHPPWRIMGFREAVHDNGLIDLRFSEYPLHG